MKKYLFEGKYITNTKVNILFFCGTIQAIIFNNLNLLNRLENIKYMSNDNINKSDLLKELGFTQASGAEKRKYFTNSKESDITQASGAEKWKCFTNSKESDKILNDTTIYIFFGLFVFSICLSLCVALNCKC